MHKLIECIGTKINTLCPAVSLTNLYTHFCSLARLAREYANETPVAWINYGSECKEFLTRNNICMNLVVRGDN
jgi:hypothetical protein